MTAAAVALAEALARQFEGCELTAYHNAHDVWTIGYGHTRGVGPGMTCTQAEADDWLDDDLAFAALAVSAAVTVALTDHQAGALIDFTYNLGQGNLDSSTLLRDVNSLDFADVPAQLARWVHDSAGNVLPGLVGRRSAEAECWNTPDDPGETS